MVFHGNAAIATVISDPIRRNRKWLQNASKKVDPGSRLRFSTFVSQTFAMVSLILTANSQTLQQQRAAAHSYNGREKVFYGKQTISFEPDLTLGYLHNLATLVVKFSRQMVVKQQFWYDLPPN